MRVPAQLCRAAVRKGHLSRYLRDEAAGAGERKAPRGGDFCRSVSRDRRLLHDTADPQPWRTTSSRRGRRTPWRSVQQTRASMKHERDRMPQEGRQSETGNRPLGAWRVVAVNWDGNERTGPSQPKATATAPQRVGRSGTVRRWCSIRPSIVRKQTLEFPVDLPPCQRGPGWRRQAGEDLDQRRCSGRRRR